jgi:hypothetical protein
MGAVMTLKNRIGRRAVCALLAAAATFAAPAGYSSALSAPPRFDGLWSVSIVTEKGTCDRGYRYPVRIENGVLVNAGDVPVVISGKVAPTGAITVTVSHNGSSASGSGRLAGSAGEGSWSGGECSGSWTAERRAPDDSRPVDRW